MEVHRCRFIEYTPSAVHCMAFNVDGSLLAVSRADGTIEVWEARGDWHTAAVLGGGDHMSVEALVWGPGERLFTAGLHGFITEWDVRTSNAIHVADSYGGPVWSLALSNEGTMLAGGCEDGCVRLYSIADGGLEYRKAFDKHPGRVLSLAWHMEDEVVVSGSSDGYIRRWNATTGRPTLRIGVQGSVDSRSAKSRKRLSNKKKNKSNKKTKESDHDTEGEDDIDMDSTLVWSVLVLEDFTIVSGDSSGAVQFWDGVHGTLRQTFRIHIADVLCMAASPDGRHVYASGVDSKLVQWSLIDRRSVGASLSSGPRNDNDGDDRNGQQTRRRQWWWVHSATHREHTHDVRALAISPAPGHVVATGGVDTNLFLYVTAPTSSNVPDVRFPNAPRRRLVPFLAGTPPVTCATVGGGLLLFRSTRKLQLWRLGSSAQTTIGNGDAMNIDELPAPPKNLASTKGTRKARSNSLNGGNDGTYVEPERRSVVRTPTLLLEMLPKDPNSIVCAAMSADAHWIAYSTAKGTRLFVVSHSFSESGNFVDEEGKATVQKVRKLPDELLPAHELIFAPDCRRLVVASNDATVQVLDLSSLTIIANIQPENIPMSIVDFGDDMIDSSSLSSRPLGDRITRLAASEDGQWLAWAHGSGVVCVLGLDTLRSQCTLPRLASPIATMAFRPGTDELVIACVSQHIFIFDVAARQLSDWSRRHSRSLPLQWMSRHAHPVVGVTFDPARPNAILLHDHMAIVVVDVTKPVPPPEANLGLGGIGKRARREQKQRELAAISGNEDGNDDAERSNNGAVGRTNARQLHGHLRPVVTTVDGFTIINRYRPLLWCGVTAANTLAVVERPWLAVLESFPPTLHRKRYNA